MDIMTEKKRKRSRLKIASLQLSSKAVELMCKALVRNSSAANFDPISFAVLNNL